MTMPFIRDYAKRIMKQSPIEYVRTAELRGNIFNSDDESGAISSAFTNFFVDHAEPLRVLGRVRQVRHWPLGELLDGNEFLLVLETSTSGRSVSTSVSKSDSEGEEMQEGSRRA